jgi:hypothetical protein
MTLLNARSKQVDGLRIGIAFGIACNIRLRRATFTHEEQGQDNSDCHESPTDELQGTPVAPSYPTTQIED